MKALFLGNVAADTAEGIKAELPPGLEVEILADPQHLLRAPEAAANADILVSNHWRADYPRDAQSDRSDQFLYLTMQIHRRDRLHRNPPHVLV